VLGTNVLSSGASAQYKIDTTNFDKGLAVLEDANKDLSVQLKNQAQEIKFLQEQVGWLSKSLEKDAQRQEEILQSVASLRRSIMISVWVITRDCWSVP
jgi:predicted RNase H-like nuclease (RuvC/YqgF family)